MTDKLIEALESTRGYIDGMLADIRGSRGDDEDALDFITATRRLRLKSLVVLQEALHHAAGGTGAPMDDIVARYGNGLTLEDLLRTYPELTQLRVERDRRHKAWEDDMKAWG